MISQIEISRVGLEGQGVGYDDLGNIYFVRGALPGDRISVSFPDTEKKYRDAVLLERHEESKSRVPSVCAYFNECGGCDWLDWDYKEQLKGKETILRHVLEKGENDLQYLKPIIAAKSPLNYRARVQLKMQGGKLGFHKRQSHDLVDIESCAVATAPLNAKIKELRSGKLAVEETKIELVFDEKNNSVTELRNAPNGHHGFTQANIEQNEVLKETIKNHLSLSASKKVLELYSGNGNLSFAIADLPLVESLVGVENNEFAVNFAREKIIEKGVLPGRMSFLNEWVGKDLLHKLPSSIRNQYDTLVVDPPRQGMGGSLKYFIHDALKTVVYVSCFPITFSKEVQCLKNNFQLVEIQPIDMFPQTRHIEFVALFQRR